MAFTSHAEYGQVPRSADRSASAGTECQQLKRGDHFRFVSFQLRVRLFGSCGAAAVLRGRRRLEVSERFSVNVGAVRYAERYRLDGAVSVDVLPWKRTCRASPAAGSPRRWWPWAAP